MKKIKLSKTGKLLLFLIVFGIIIGIAGNKFYKNYLYKQTYEYKLLEKGYELSDVKKLEKLYSKERLDYILKIDINDYLIDLAKSDYYTDKNLEDYLSYIDENDVDIKTAILKINTHTNYDFYDHDIEATNLTNTMIVNKYYYLKEDFVPKDLIDISSKYAWGTDNKATKDTLDAFIKMQKDCLEQTGIQIMINSSYRSYKEQSDVYELYKKSYDEEYADKIAARPGHSEHQTGLSLDIFSYKDRSQKTFAEGETYKWLKENCSNYGFILRYPENKEYITGFEFESWHYRYVGVDIAKDMTAKNLTYDEYYEYYLNNKS